MKKFKQAFTLIELMIVVSIIGILSVIAIPTYQDYVIRIQISEGMNLSDDIKTVVTKFFRIVALGQSTTSKLACRYPQI